MIKLNNYFNSFLDKNKYLPKTFDSKTEKNLTIDNFESFVIENISFTRNLHLGFTMQMSLCNLPNQWHNTILVDKILDSIKYEESIVNTGETL